MNITNNQAPAGAELDEGDELESEIDDSEPGEDPRVRFYVAPVSTVVLLHFCTFGLYALYWFYRHWQVRRLAGGASISPLGRAFFPIFFVHQLFRVIDREARATGLSPTWKPGSQATIYVGLLFAARIIDRLGSDEMSGIALAFCLSALSAAPLAVAQGIANLANGRTAIDEDEDETA